MTTVSARWLVGLGCLFGGIVALQADSTIDPNHRDAYGANIGWVNMQGDVTHGAVFGQAYGTGYVWSANAGWISLGNGPTNGWQYQNSQVNDWGVNHDGEGRLTGHAWGANIGWLTFEQTYGQPRIDLLTGNLSGYVWGANVGWISLTNASAFVRTVRLDRGPDVDGDGIPDWFEMKTVGNLTTLHGGGHDADLDGVPDEDEYYADTNPLDDTEYLAITAFTSAHGTNTVTWPSRPTRFYRVEATNTLAGAGGAWTDEGGLIGPPATSPSSLAMEEDEENLIIYRVRAIPPLP